MQRACTPLPRVRIRKQASVSIGVRRFLSHAVPVEPETSETLSEPIGVVRARLVSAAGCEQRPAAGACGRFTTANGDHLGELQAVEQVDVGEFPVAEPFGQQFRVVLSLLRPCPAEPRKLRYDRTA